MKNLTQNLFFVALLLFGTTIYAQETSDDSMDLEELEEIVLIGGGVIDLAEDRVTPVASSTIKSEEIQKKVGNLDITNVLLNTPSVYVSSQGRGFGDTRISIRGFDQTNTAFMLNGQPINGMEDGKMYWSNWSGMSDIANAIQVQRGLGASKLAISSVGGTVNFVMKSASKSQGGFISQGMANDNYLKSTVSYDTGMNENGWATSFLLSHWQGDGYMDGTKGAGQNYFLSIGYKMNEKHSFNFLMTGAPQYHDNADDPLTIDEYLVRGRKHNENWGYYGNQYKSLRTNFYHKPVFNLNWDYNINDKSSLSTVLYVNRKWWGYWPKRLHKKNGRRLN
jgi:outer membrane receptor for Fe3+-dicitrate